MKEVITEIEINASISKTWEVFSAFSEYHKWNPFIKSISGDVNPGNTIIVILQQPGMKPMKMKPKVISFKKEEELVWIGHLFILGIFDGEHSFRFIKNKDGSTKFIQKELFKGLIVPMLNRMLDKNTKNGFELMNEKLKHEVEMKRL